MTKTLNHNNRNLVLLIIIWALVFALTLIGVYIYYDQKIEQLEQSIDKQSEPVGHRMSALLVRRVLKIPSREGKSKDSKAKPVESNEGCVRTIAEYERIVPHDPRLVNTPLIHSLHAHGSVPSQEGIPFEPFFEQQNKF